MKTTHPRSRVVVAVASALAFAALAGCGTTSTIARRIHDNPDIFAAATPWQQELIRQGYIDRGFTPELVLIALEKPTRVTTDAATGAVQWYYHNIYTTSGSAVVGRDRGIDPNSARGRREALGPGHVDASAPVYVGGIENYILVTFTEGIVTSIEIHQG